MENDKMITSLTIMTKHSLFSFLGVVGGEMVDEDEESRPISAVIKLDPREGQPVLKEYKTQGEAIRNYYEAISTSVERGWSVVYRGRPLRG